MRIRRATIEDIDSLKALLAAPHQVADAEGTLLSSEDSPDYSDAEIRGLIEDESNQVLVAVGESDQSEAIVGCAISQPSQSLDDGQPREEVRIFCADELEPKTFANLYSHLSSDLSRGADERLASDRGDARTDEPAYAEESSGASGQAQDDAPIRENPYEAADILDLSTEGQEDDAGLDEDGFAPKDHGLPPQSVDEVEEPTDAGVNAAHTTDGPVPDLPSSPAPAQTPPLGAAIGDPGAHRPDNPFSPDSPSYYRRGRPPIPERPRKKKNSWTPVFVVFFFALIVSLGILGGFALRQIAIVSERAERSENEAVVEEKVAEEAHIPVGEDIRPSATPTVEDDEGQEDVPSPAVCEPRQIDLMMIGDMLMHDEVVFGGYRPDGSFNYDYLFYETSPWIDEADLKILNQETVMGSPSLGYRLYMGAAGPIMNTPTALADTEAAYGFNCILKATNHTLDLGYAGLEHELDYWGSTYPNIPVVGVNNPSKIYTDDQSQNWVDNVLVLDFDGLKVGILNYTWATNESVNWDSDHAVISYLSEDKIKSDVEKARQMGAEFIVACPHWGIEYQTTPSYEEEYYSTIFCNLGVDVIFGCHPHVLQPVEVLTNEEGHQTVCFYSLGNYVCASIMEDNSFIGGIARATLTRNEQGGYAVTAASLIPTVIRYASGEDLRPYPLAAYTNQMAANSQRPRVTPDYAYNFCASVFGDTFKPDLGFVVLDLPQEGRRV